MREIKFRAWDKLNKVMKYYTLKELAGEDKFGYETEFEAIQSGFDNWEWVQYTGLKDGNGKEIYEGDILVTRTADGFPAQLKVEFIDGAFVASTFYYIIHRPPKDWYLCEVVGNIYENPELIEHSVGMRN